MKIWIRKWVGAGWRVLADGLAARQGIVISGRDPSSRF
jgi:hypothetical protein